MPKLAQLRSFGTGVVEMEKDSDLMSKKASLTAGLIGAVMIVLLCFGAAFAFIDVADAKIGPQMHQANPPADDA